MGRLPSRAGRLLAALALGAFSGAQGGNLAPPRILPVPEATLAPVPRPPGGGEIVAVVTVRLPRGAYLRLPGEAFEPLVAEGRETPGISWHTVELSPVRMAAPRGQDRFPVMLDDFTVKFRGRLDPGVRRPGRPVVFVGGMVGLAGGGCTSISSQLEGVWAPWTAPTARRPASGRLVLESKQPVRVHLPRRETVLLGSRIETELPPGEHTLLVDAPGRHPRLETITIQAGATRSLEVDLEPEKKASLLLSVYPEGARVSESGRVLGLARPHLVLPLAPGSHVLEIELAGHVTRIASFELRSGSRRRALYRLAPTSQQ